MSNILLLGATFGTGNMGVGALTAGALTVVAQRFPGATVSLLDYGRKPTVSVTRVGGKAVSVSLINLRFSWKILLANNIAGLLAVSLVTHLFGKHVRNRVIRRNPWLTAIARADAAVAVSGGDSFSDIYGMGRFFYVALPQLLSVSLGVKLIMLPQTIGPFHGGPSRCIARFLLRRSALVFSRDKAGVEEVHRLLGAPEHDDKVRFCVDMGFVVEPRRPVHLDLGGLKLPRGTGERPLVGLNISGLLMMGGYTKSNMFDLKLDYGALIDCLVTHLIEVKKVDVLLVPHVFGDHEESDTVAAHTAHARLKGRHGLHLFCTRGSYDQNEIKYIIGLCDFFVGSRMHACIAALSQGIPAVGVAYSDKFAGVFDSIDMGSMVADPRNLTARQMIDTVAAAFDERKTTSARLCEAMPNIKARVLAMLDDVA